MSLGERAMIQSKAELKEYIAADNSWHGSQGWGIKERLIADIAHYTGWRIKKYLILLRKQEYYINTANGNRIKGFLAVYYEGRKNALGERLGIEIGPNCFGKGLQIFHGGIVVNANVKVGENCKLHGGNCIGNNGKTNAAPRIGDNVDIGYGAVLIGDIEIADDVVIGANAVVNRSIAQAGCIAVGVPAKEKKQN